MAFYVYIIQSDRNNRYYKGVSENQLIRLQQHNDGQTNSIKHLVPWKVVYLEEMLSKREALIREKNLKRPRMKVLKNI